MFLSSYALLFFATYICLEAQAAIYVVKPSSGSLCHGGKNCTVQWLDDGQRPLLSAISMTTVGLYTGDEKLVQTITPIDVSSSLSFSFVPDPKAGPNSDTYYISFTSVNYQENGTAYQGFSPFFRLDDMSGSFASPLPAATSSIPIPSETPTSTQNTDVISSSSRMVTIQSSAGLSAPTLATTSTSSQTPSSNSAMAIHSTTLLRSLGLSLILSFLCLN